MSTCSNTVHGTSQRKCAVYVFHEDFKDWSIYTDSCGNDILMVGYAGADIAAGPPPPATECKRISVYEYYNCKQKSYDECGNLVTLIGFPPPVAHGDCYPPQTRIVRQLDGIVTSPNNEYEIVFDHDGRWTNWSLKLPRIDFEDEVAFIKTYDTLGVETKVAIPANDSTVFLKGSVVIYLDSANGQQFPPIADLSDLTTSNAFDTFQHAFDFVNNSNVLSGTNITFDCLGQFSAAGEISQTTIKGPDFVSFRGRGNDYNNMIVDVGVDTLESSFNVNGLNANFSNITFRFIQNQAAGEILSYAIRVSRGNSDLTGTIKITGSYDQGLSSSEESGIMRLSDFSSTFIRDCTFIDDMSNGSVLRSRFFVTRGARAYFSRNVVFNNIRQTTYLEPLIDINPGCFLTLFPVGGNPIQFTGQYVISPNTVDCSSVSVIAVSGDYGTSIPTIKNYNFGAKTSSGGPNSVMAINSLAAINKLSGTYI